MCVCVCVCVCVIEQQRETEWVRAEIPITLGYHYYRGQQKTFYFSRKAAACWHTILQLLDWTAIKPLRGRRRRRSALWDNMSRQNGKEEEIKTMQSFEGLFMNSLSGLYFFSSAVKAFITLTRSQCKYRLVQDNALKTSSKETAEN